MVICGDSFNIGIGCHDLATEPYGQLLSVQLNKPIVNLAKGSSTNLSIYLQAKYAVENIDCDLVIVSPTSYDRVDWFPIDYEFEPNGYINLTDVNYHEYPPYGLGTYHVKDQHIQLEHAMADNPEYRGAMFTENLMGIINYWETFGQTGLDSGDYYAKFRGEDPRRLKALYDYAQYIHEPRLNRLHTVGMMTMAHNILTRKGIRHLILTHEPEHYSEYIDNVNLLKFNWGQLSLDYPDDLPSWHASAAGHRVAADLILEGLKTRNWI